MHLFGGALPLSVYVQRQISACSFQREVRKEPAERRKAHF